MADNGKKKVLIVDDEPDIVTFLSVLLEDNGFSVATASTGLEAMSRIRAERPDLITLDITMPEQSGVRTYREIKSDPALAGIPVIIVTGVADEFQKFLSTRKQVPPPEGYVSKPIEAEALIALARRLVGA
ncbi:MAG: response regulator [Deltaproteobacteria bacterium]|nr:response regulator [Deltaproteobacteria bacterium]